MHICIMFSYADDFHFSFILQVILFVTKKHLQDSEENCLLNTGVKYATCTMMHISPFAYEVGDYKCLILDNYPYILLYHTQAETSLNYFQETSCILSTSRKTEFQACNFS